MAMLLLPFADSSRWFKDQSLTSKAALCQAGGPDLTNSRASRVAPGLAGRTAWEVLGAGCIQMQSSSVARRFTFRKAFAANACSTLSAVMRLKWAAHAKGYANASTRKPGLHLSRREFRPTHTHTQAPCKANTCDLDPAAAQHKSLTLVFKMVAILPFPKQVSVALSGRWLTCMPGIPV